MNMIDPQDGVKEFSTLKVFRHLTVFRVNREDSEARLVQEARHGDRNAFDILVRRFEAPLRGFLERRVGEAAADDVLQDTLLAGWIALPKFHRQSRFKAWLFGIACHKCVDHYRTESRAPMEMPLEEADGMWSSFSIHTDWQDHADRKQFVSDLLQRLCVEQREVLEIYYYAGLTLAETARALNRNLSTVKGQFYRAHARIAQSMPADSVKAIADDTENKSDNRILSGEVERGNSSFLPTARAATFHGKVTR